MCSLLRQVDTSLHNPLWSHLPCSPHLGPNPWSSLTLNFYFELKCELNELCTFYYSNKRGTNVVQKTSMSDFYILYNHSVWCVISACFPAPDNQMPWEFFTDREKYTDWLASLCSTMSLVATSRCQGPSRQSAQGQHRKNKLGIGVAY